MNSSKYDEYLAKQIEKELNCTGITENAVLPKDGKENYRPKTLVDETLEFIDPTPNIYTLFVQFNEKFFWNKLLPVQVRWSPRMTSCAGICSFHPRNRECVIALSTPLLKLRPRKDLIETLLHEMIHAYLFLTNDNRDRDGHGPIFQSHMKRINKEAGTNITIYHTFHDEVRLYQQHWWRCNGPCQHRAPFFGTVRRSMNRAPGPNDLWWKDHQASCNGQFIKIKEPEKVEKKKKTDPKKRSSISNSTVTKTPDNKSILNWINKPSESKVSPINNFNQNKIGNSNNVKTNTTSTTTTTTTTSNIQTNMKKLGNSTNNVHGWGTGGPSGNSNLNESKKSANDFSKNTRPGFSFSGTLGGSGSGRSNLLDKFSNTASNNQKNNSWINTGKKEPIITYDLTKDTGTNSEIISKTMVQCPNCNKSVDEQKINQHLDLCLDTAEDPEIVSVRKRKISNDDYPRSNKICKITDSSSEEIPCPLCNKKLNPSTFNDHLENCLQSDFKEQKNDDCNSSTGSVKLQDSPSICLICEKSLKPNETLNDHLEDCVSSVFRDTEENEIEFDNEISFSSKNDLEILDTSNIDHDNTIYVLDCYPCPVCLSMVKKNIMNEHLDTCLNK